MAIPTYTREQLITLVNQYLVPNSNILATEHNEIETAIVNAIYGQIGDIKEIACDINYINTNFNMNGLTPGLGKSTGERYGWAICNGNNGTVDKGGNVSVGYSPSKGYLLTGPGPNNGGPGEKTVTLTIAEIPPHSHKYHEPSFNRGHKDGGSDETRYGNENLPKNGTSAITGGFGSTSTGNTTGGSTVAHNNMQPYIVTLFIQRIPV